MSNPLNPYLIPKYVNQLVVPRVFQPYIDCDPVTGEEYHYYRITMAQFEQQLLPEGFPPSTVWGYGGCVYDPECGYCIYQETTPGATFEAIRGIPMKIQWINGITVPNFLAVDPTVHWANPNNMEKPTPPFLPFPPGYAEAQFPVPLVTHLHGGEVRSDSDGGPNDWFTFDEEIVGPGFVSSLYTYPNEQEAATLWYHDHTLGITSQGVLAGLAGFYTIYDPESPVECYLPPRDYDIPLVIQDRLFNEDGSINFPSNGVNPEIHPYWRPDYFGDTIMVNGRVWPNLNVERRQYRFRILNGSNTRTYNMSFSNNLSMTQIASDGGFLEKPVILTELLLATAERAEVLVDFSELEPGTKIILTNDANAPFPLGAPVDPNTLGQIMQFTVMDTCPVKPPVLPSQLNKIPKLCPDVPPRILTLNVTIENQNALTLTLDGQRWGAPISETPVVGSTEEWILVNLTNDSHPIHVHLIQFQIKDRQDFDVSCYESIWTQLNGTPPLDNPTKVLEVEPFLEGEPILPDPNEMGWKDTVIAYPGQVTRLLLRFAPQDADPLCVRPGINLFPFDPTIGPGYVWHCHILDHEDNEMMRPYIVTKGRC